MNGHSYAAAIGEGTQPAREGRDVNETTTLHNAPHIRLWNRDGPCVYLLRHKASNGCGLFTASALAQSKMDKKVDVRRDADEGVVSHLPTRDGCSRIHLCDVVARTDHASFFKVTARRMWEL